MLRKLLNTSEFIVFHKDERGKPMVGNFPHEVSIAHSHDMAAVLVSEQKHVGLDIELIDPKVKKIAHKFLSTGELKMIDPNEETKQLMLGWCAKEALFKLYGKGQVDFIKDLYITLTKIETKGSIQARISKPDHENNYTVEYEIIGDYMLCFVTGRPIEG